MVLHVVGATCMAGCTRANEKPAEAGTVGQHSVRVWVGSVGTAIVRNELPVPNKPHSSRESVEGSTLLTVSKIRHC